MIKKASKYCLVGLISTIALVGGTVVSDDSQPSISSVSIKVKGYEFGPSVPQVIVKLNSKISSVSKDKLSISTAGSDRTISSVYLSNKNGQKISSSSSRFIAINMAVTYDSKTFSTPGTPFTYNMTSFQNNWSDSYPVSIKGLAVSKGKTSVTLTNESDAIANRISPDTDVFAIRKSFTGNYTNPLTKASEEITLHYAAYEPESLSQKQKNPLIIWLHGQGEGGTDTDITLLGNEVVALAKKGIQKHFTSGKQTGAYVLAVQTPTYWMDEGDGTNGAGAGISRYSEILMDTIKDYVSSNKDIDPDRIYLAGGSNGGYMTLNMALQYPDYFAALVPQAAAYSYYQYERNDDGTYKQVDSETSISGKAHVRTDDIFFDDSKVEALKDTPIWFVHAANDTVVDPTTYALPIYKSLIDKGAKNAWFSYFDSVEGSDMKDTSYMGHWSWTYFFNDKIAGVQNVKKVKKSEDLSGFAPSNKTKGGSSSASYNGKTYDNLFDWLNAQKK